MTFMGYRRAMRDVERSASWHRDREDWRAADERRGAGAARGTEACSRCGVVRARRELEWSDRGQCCPACVELVPAATMPWYRDMLTPVASVVGYATMGAIVGPFMANHRAEPSWWLGGLCLALFAAYRALSAYRRATERWRETPDRQAWKAFGVASMSTWALLATMLIVGIIAHR